jgi:hypothetical protein
MLPSNTIWWNCKHDFIIVLNQFLLKDMLTLIVLIWAICDWKSKYFKMSSNKGTNAASKCSNTIWWNCKHDFIIAQNHYMYAPFLHLWALFLDTCTPLFNRCAHLWDPYAFLLDACVPLLDPCAPFMDLCINFWSMSLLPWELHGRYVAATIDKLAYVLLWRRSTSNWPISDWHEPYRSDSQTWQIDA